MFKVRAVQAAFGDSLIVEYGTAASPRFLLIDGGPDGTFGDHLQGELQTIAASGGALDLTVLSHVDNDHVIGLLDFFSLLRSQVQGNTPPLIQVGGLWHNAFSKA